MKRSFLLLVFLLGFFAVHAGAQEETSPGVARLSLIQGDVSVQRGDTGDWAAAALNQPLVVGDRISTGDHSQAELQLDHASILRLGNDAHAKIAALERTHVQVQIGQGLAYYTVSKDADSEVEIDTPNAAIRPTSKEGAYRIEVNGFETQVIVRAGAAEISTPQGSTRVEVGQEATVRGTSEDAGNVLGGAPSKDSWDSWNNDRDVLIRSAESWKRTNRFYVGSEDLDAYGRWVTVPDYGLVWSPTVGVGWAPYRSGRWIWQSYWGWTWVSREPWGWAPYHYGRWLLHGSSWMWWPGPVDDDKYRPSWAPAYVSFFGLGGHRGVSAGFTSVGWLPIGPGDYFYPWYGRFGAPLNVVNVVGATTSTSINSGFGGVPPLREDNEFSNVSLAAIDVRVRGAISTLPVDHFGTGRSSPTTISRAAFRGARMLTGKLPIVPTGETLSATNRPANASSITRAGLERRFFAKKSPAPVPQSFDTQALDVQEGNKGNGPLIPVREVTQLDSARTAPPMPLENATERTVLPVGNAQSESRPRPLRVSRAASSPRIPKSNTKPTRRMMALPPAPHATKARLASKSNGSSRTSSYSRVTTSTRRMTMLARGSQGATARVAQSYVESANRQMDRGNYSAAIAGYKRAGQFDRNTSAAKARVERARRAMQAENDIIAARR